MLHESFWSAFARDISTLSSSIGELYRGRAALKRYLASVACVDVKTLPYDQTVIAFIDEWRTSGGRTILVTASDQALAESIAQFLDIFDEVHGSNGMVNLKGEQKGEFLEERFGLEGFTYMGDAKADIPVWKRASKAITINASASLRQEAENACKEVEHLTTKQFSIRPYLKAARPHHWVKNVLIFIPAIAAQQIGGPTLMLSFLAFICFSCVASSVYLLNDLLDLGADRMHPHKMSRPFAAGSVPIAHGTLMASVLILLGFLLAFIISVDLLLILTTYFLLSMLYSLTLKRQVVIDIFILATLFTTRLIAGAVAVDILLSVWLISFSMFFFLSLAAIKRQAEMVAAAARGQLTANRRGYHIDDLPIIAMVGLGAGYMSVLVLMLYINSPNVASLYNFPNALWGVCAVILYWITRTVIIAHRGEMHYDPLVYAFKDRISQICFLAIVCLVGAAIIT